MPSLALRHPASVDRLRDADAPLALQAAGVLGFAALTAVLAQVDLRIYLWEVPLTLQTLGVYASGLFLGRRNGALAMGVYLLLGLALPVFSGGGSGLTHLMGATGGYLVGFPLASFMAGHVTHRARGLWRSVLAILCGSLALFACGITGLVLLADVPLADAIVNGWLRFVPWDVTKIALIASLYGGTRRATRDE